MTPHDSASGDIGTPALGTDQTDASQQPPAPEAEAGASPSPAADVTSGDASPVPSAPGGSADGLTAPVVSPATPAAEAHQRHSPDATGYSF